MSDLGQGAVMPEFDPHAPFTTKSGLAAGISPRELAGRGFQRLLFGIHISSARTVTARLRAEAVLLVAGPRAFVSHQTAARVRGVPVPDGEALHATVPDYAARVSRGGIVSHVRPDARHDIVKGIRVSTREDLFVELAAELSLVDLVVVGDHLVRKGLNLQRLQRAASQVPGRVGKHARAAASYVRERVDSPMETRLRMLLVLAGVPEPEVNREMRNEIGDIVRRFDLCWPSVKVIFEYDGRHHIERVEQWEADIERREQLEDASWRIVTVVARGVFVDPGLTVERAFKVLRAAGLQGLPARPRDDWRAHFPGRASAA